MLYIIFIPQTLKWCPFLTPLACNNHSNDIVASTLEITHHSICTHLLISIHNSAHTPPFAYKPPYIFSQSSSKGIFISRIGPPNMYGQRRNSYTPRSPWWSGNARMKPVYTEQPRNLPLIASVFSSQVSVLQRIERTNPGSARKTPPSTLWPTSVSRSWPQGIWVSGGREKGRQTGVEPAYIQRLSRRGTRRGGEGGGGGGGGGGRNCEIKSQIPHIN